jgi:uncharacterized protein YacL
MVLVEIIRMLIVLGLTAIGYQLGGNPPSFIDFGSPETTLLLMTVFGAGIGYVAGGIFGRTLSKLVGVVEKKVDKVQAGELLVGSLGILIGVASGLLLSWPILMAVRTDYVAYSVAAILIVFMGTLAYRIAIRKSFDLLGLMRLAPRHELRGKRSTGSAVKILDSSALIDGMILDVVKSGFVTGHVLCPSFVLEEIQSIADSGDQSTRARGRRALEILEALASDPRTELEIGGESYPAIDDVDAKLVEAARQLDGVLITTDYNLHKVAELQGIHVLNVRTLSSSLRPTVMAGESVLIRIIKEGTRSGQGVGYLDDGTMVVVEGAADLVGEEVQASVTSVLQTGAGRMLFASRSDVT